MALNLDPQPNLGDEFGQDTLMGLSEFETFIDAMDVPNGLSTGDQMNDYSSGFASQTAMSHSGMTIEDNSASGTSFKMEGADQSRGQDWVHSVNGEIRYAPSSFGA